MITLGWIGMSVLVWTLGGLLLGALAVRSGLFEIKSRGSGGSIVECILIYAVGLAVAPALGIAVLADQFKLNGTNS